MLIWECSLQKKPRLGIESCYALLCCTALHCTALSLSCLRISSVASPYTAPSIIVLTICRAHDRALIRAIGPSNCRTVNLNFPVSEYSCEPLSRFMEFDEKLKGQLFATAWTGLKHCDFGFLLIRGAQNPGHASLQMQHQVQKLAQLSSALGTDSPTQASQSRTSMKAAATVKAGLRVRSGSSISAPLGHSAAAAAPSSSSSNETMTAAAPSSFAFTSVSLKSRIVKEADVQRNKVAPPVFGALLSVSNVPSIGSLSHVSTLNYPASLSIFMIRWKVF
jgi:hypothetical protein